ncbi:M23 family metallopeptidase [Gracilimonas sp.]|uniref:M23 family metallopeptidase n=1 Tax=Gracilimonas sp. TaxID=1974203 RepID=UPI003D0FB09D
MPVSKLSGLILLFFTLIFSNAFAQYADLPITIEVEYNDDGEPTFYAKNKSLTPYTVSLDFSSVSNAMPPNPNPYKKTARFGKTRLLEIKKSGLSDSYVRFSYTYSYNIGCLDTEPDDLEYLLPVAEGKATEIFGLSHIGELFDKETPDDFYALGFRAEAGDTVYASRGGVITDIEVDHDDSETENYFTSNYNYVQIVHEDCTFGSYSHLKKGGILVQKGDEVVAGDPIGIVASKDDETEIGFRFTLAYKNDDYRGGSDDKYWNYAVPLFRTSVEKNAKLKPDHIYRAVHPVDIITQEMGWFERRRWKKRNR